MYTAKIISKEYVNGALKVTVEFTDGTTSVQEFCIPQDFDGLKYWVKSRLATFNGAKEIDTTFSVDDEIDVTEPIVQPPAPTAEEIARDAWLKNYFKWVKVKTTLIDTGILTGNETKVVQLKTKVQTDFLPTYIDDIPY